jgi:hypothetical protein
MSPRRPLGLWRLCWLSLLESFSFVFILRVLRVDVYAQILLWMVPTVDEALRIHKGNPTVFLIHADLFDDKTLASIKDCFTCSNVLCLLKLGLCPLHV